MKCVEIFPYPAEFLHVWNSSFFLSNECYSLLSKWHFTLGVVLEPQNSTQYCKFNHSVILRWICLLQPTNYTDFLTLGNLNVAIKSFKTQVSCIYLHNNSIQSTHLRIKSTLGYERPWSITSWSGAISVTNTSRGKTGIVLYIQLIHPHDIQNNKVMTLYILSRIKKQRKVVQKYMCKPWYVILQYLSMGWSRRGRRGG